MEEMKPVVFSLDKENYGVDIERVQGIERQQQIVRVPNTVSYIKGIINLRGDIIPVYDLREKFKLPKTEAEDRQYIIVNVKNSKIALEVDGVTEIHNVESGNLFDIPSIATGAGANCFDKVIKNGDNLIIVINVDHLLSDEEMNKIEEIINN
jgi:purine-binding chemotaxis protein CheW